jgi:hypothetical protein
MGEYVTLDKRFTVFFLTGSSGSFSYFHVSFLIPFLEEAFLRNIIIIPYINCIIVIWSSDNGSVINNNNYGGLHDLILLFKIPMDTLTYFCQIYRQFGSRPQEGSAALFQTVSWDPHSLLSDRSFGVFPAG